MVYKQNSIFSLAASHRSPARMRKSFMNNIKHFVDSNVRQRIDRAANNNNDFFDDDLLLVERQFEDMRHVCVETEKRISALLQSLASSPLGAYTQNVQASLNNLSTNLSATNSSPINSTINDTTHHPKLVQKNPANETQFSAYHNSIKQSSRCKTSTISSQNESILPTMAASNLGNSNQLLTSNSGLNDTTVIHEDLRRHKKLPIVRFLKFLVKSCYKLRPDSLLATTMTHCSLLQTHLTKLYLNYEQTIELQCLKPIQHIIDNDVPNVIKLRKLFIKSHNDLESVKAKYNGVSQKQQQTNTSHFTSTSYTITQNSVHQANINKLDQLKKELDDAVTRFEQARDTYATELYAFVCRETELVNLLMKFYQYQAEYQLQVGNIIQNSLPSLSDLIAGTPRKVVFGTSLEEHLRCTGRSVSLVIELCVHILYSRALNEEGLFRIPGSSVKIKKLKNAINAWFVTLASQVELEKGQRGALSSVIAVHDLFKEIAGQRPQQSQTIGDIISNNQISSTTARDDSASSQIIIPTTDCQHDLVFDVHTMAGLLKLYLRELPEPLFTYALYQQCLDATAKSVKDNQPDALGRVIQQLPKANYDNLHHLIRFLHLLTCHREMNKMTATNLAITMAPSLIWASPSHNINSHQTGQTDQVFGGEQQQGQEEQILNVHMSSVGISASLHALVIENLISNAEKLFPGPAQFTIAGLDEAPAELCSKIQQLSTQDRCTESSSPTGLSTASSSSYSSTSNASLTHLRDTKHSRKGGSMDGLLSQLNRSVSANQSSYTTRPYSVQLHQREVSQSQPPPVPPAPAARSLMKHVSDSTSTLRPATSHKPPAPPIPPTSNLKRQQYIPSDSSSLKDQTADGTKTFNSLVQSALATGSTSGSFRGIGVLATVAASSISAPRPTVPPPNRPPGTTSEIKTDSCHDHKRTHINNKEDNNYPGDSKISHSLASSGNFRADFEEINAIDVDDVSVPSGSPIVSLDDTISGDDSSFDNECQSLEHSWTDCDLELANQVGKSSDNLSKEVDTKPEVGSHKPKLVAEQINEHYHTREHDISSKVIQDTGMIGDSPATCPPVKPPRSISPKVTQSTPL